MKACRNCGSGGSRGEKVNGVVRITCFDCKHSEPLSEWVTSRTSDIRPDEFPASLVNSRVNELSPEALGQIVEAIESDKIAISLPYAIDKLTDALMTDADYRRSWQANIAMAFYDAYQEEYGVTINKGSEVVHKIANNGAKRFLDNLIRDVK